MIFFGPLRRRDAYERRTDGSYYAYARYRAAIAEDCRCHCVYCGCHEDVIGGREAMETDHFRPWQKAFEPNGEQKFLHLKNEPTNLVHSCGVCNGYKREFWPTEDPDIPYDNVQGWIDPFLESRELFIRLQTDGSLTSARAPAEYQIRKLRLNRPFLRRLREHYLLRVRLEQMMAVIRPKWTSVVAQNPGTPQAEIAKEGLEILEVVERIFNE